MSVKHRKIRPLNESVSKAFRVSPDKETELEVINTNVPLCYDSPDKKECKYICEDTPIGESYFEDTPDTKYKLKQDILAAESTEDNNSLDTHETVKKYAVLKGRIEKRKIGDFDE